MRLRAAGLLVGLLSLALLVAFVQAGGARPQPNKVKQTAKPVLRLAVDGPRVAYLMRNGKVGVWNVVTGASLLVKSGDYPSKGSGFGSYGFGRESEVAIAGKRVAMIARTVGGNNQETNEWLYTAPLGGFARWLGPASFHDTEPGDCGFSSGDWIAGLVGSGQTLAVSTWKSSGSVATDERLALITRNGLRTIATGPGAIVAQSASGSRIATLRSTDAWPAARVGPATTTPTADIYSTKGALLGEIPLSTPTPNPCGAPFNIIRLAISGRSLVVLRMSISPVGSLTSALDVYDWTTGALVHSWPLALNDWLRGGDRLAVSGRVAVIEGFFKPQLIDLTSGKEVTIVGSRPGSPATIGPSGLVYGINPQKDGRHGKLVFVPTAKLSTILH